MVVEYNLSQVEESSNRESVEGNNKLFMCSMFPELPENENSENNDEIAKNESLTIWKERQDQVE